MHLALQLIKGKKMEKRNKDSLMLMSKEQLVAVIDILENRLDKTQKEAPLKSAFTRNEMALELDAKVAECSHLREQLNTLDSKLNDTKELQQAMAKLLSLSRELNKAASTLYEKERNLLETAKEYALSSLLGKIDKKEMKECKREAYANAVAAEALKDHAKEISKISASMSMIAEVFGEEALAYYAPKEDNLRAYIAKHTEEHKADIEIDRRAIRASDKTDIDKERQLREMLFKMGSAGDSILKSLGKEQEYSSY